MRSERREKLDKSRETVGEARRWQEKQGRRWRVRKGQKRRVEKVGAGQCVKAN